MNDAAVRARSLAPLQPAERWGGRLLVFLVALVPLPLGGYLPIAWSIEAIVVGVIGMAIALAAYGKRAPPHALTLFGRITLWLTLLLAAALVAQCEPVGLIGWPVVFHNAEGVAFTSNWLSLAPGDTLLMLMRVAVYALYFFMLFDVARSRRFPREALGLLYAIVVAYALLGLFLLRWGGDTLLWVDKWAYKGDATAIFVNRNTFATFLAMGLPAGLALLIRALAPTLPHEDQRASRSGLVVTTLLASLLLVTLALLATHSRMGLVAAAAGSAVTLMLGLGRILSRKLLLLVLIVVPLLIIALVLLSGRGLLERIVSLPQEAHFRLDLYRQEIEMIARRPLLGYGGGAFTSAYPLFHRPPVETVLEVNKAHNSYLGLWLELGLIAGSIPMVIGIGVVVAALKRFRLARTSWHVPLATLGALTAGAVHSLTDFSLEVDGAFFLLLALAAIGTNTANLRAKHADRRSIDH
jgi:O-antigen ligase